MSYSSPRPRFSDIAISLVAVFLVLWGTSFYHFFRQVLTYRQLAEESRLPAKVESDEAIVVLTGDQKRIPKAFELLRTRGSPWLIISGIGKHSRLTDVIQQQSGSSEKIHELWNKILLDQSTSTVGNAVASADFVKSKKLHRLILVTHDYHMWRAVNIFKKVLPGIEIYPFPVLSNLTDWELIGTRTFLESYWHVWVEYWKLVLYYSVTSHFVHPQNI